jgi:hypothetical protein
MLFEELSSDTTKHDDSLAEDEPAYSEIIEDASDIPIDVVCEHIVSGSRDLDSEFLADADGILSCVSAVEDPDSEPHCGEVARAPVPQMEDIEEVEKAALGRGHHKKKGSQHFGGSSKWWMH